VLTACGDRAGMGCRENWWSVRSADGAAAVVSVP